jgi:hypothetical protein
VSRERHRQQSLRVPFIWKALEHLPHIRLFVSVTRQLVDALRIMNAVNTLVWMWEPKENQTISATTP